MTRDRFLRDLQQIGLSEEETEIYLRLLETGPVKVSRLTPYFEMSRSKLYRVLDRLTDEGIVVKSLQRPTRYEAVDPEKVIRARLSSIEQEKEQLEDLLGTVVEPLRRIQGQGCSEIDHHWTRIEGGDRLFEALRRATRGAEERIWWTSTRESVLRLEIPAVDKLWKVTSAIADDGVDARMLLAFPEDRLDRTLPLGGSPVEIRRCEHDRRPVDFAIMDEEAFLWARSEEAVIGLDGEAAVLWTNAPGVRSPLSLLFEQLWAQGEG